MFIEIITALSLFLMRVNIFPMKNAYGKLEEFFLDGSAQIACPPELTPAPGQYLLAHANGSNAPLSVALFPSLSNASNGFRCSPPIPAEWQPGQALNLFGPLGRRFVVPGAARKVALVAWDDSPARLLGLISFALKQNAEIVLVSDSPVADLLEVVEVQPLKGLLDVLAWADYAAFDIDRENLVQMQEKLAGSAQITAKLEAQVLVRAHMPCGAAADCGVCAIHLRHDWKMVCKDGPVFELRELLG